MIVGIVQARATSARLPGKVLLPILGRPMLARQCERLRRSKRLDKLIVATSDDAADDAVETACHEMDVECFRGNLADVLDRFYQAARAHDASHVVRLTGDCPLIDPDLVDEVVRLHLEQHNDYTSNALERTFPDGLDVEVVRLASLETAWREAKLPSQREHVTPFLYQNADRFRLGSLRGEVDRSHLRWTVDEPADLEVTSRIYERLYPDRPAFTTADILALLEAEPALATDNAHIPTNEGYARSLAAEAGFQPEDPPRFTCSESMLERALRVIPLASQTFSKSITQFPRGASPLFIERADGCRVWDVDGNEYLDFVNGLMAVSLGYNDPDVNRAVSDQLAKGVIFSLPHPLETEVAEKIVELVPCAERVRFCKNGSDATAGTVRLARACTGRDRVAVCGYHGWHDWYIATTTRDRGVPAATAALTHSFAYNDVSSLEKLLGEHPGQFAAVILEPMNVRYPAGGFLEAVRDLTRAAGALLVFDETITGFRFARGGAQELFGVTPDLATFGKGLANGLPLSVVTGRREVMQLMEEIFFSRTFGGETLSLAAARAVLHKMEREPVIETIARLGERVIEKTRQRIARHSIGGFLEVSGHPAWSFLVFADAAPYTSLEIKTLFMQEAIARGILTLGTHNLSYAHTDASVDRLVAVYDEVFPILRDAVVERRLEGMLRCEPLRPLMTLRPTERPE